MCISLLLLLTLINISLCELGIRASQFDYYITSTVVFTQQWFISQKGCHMQVREALEEFLAAKSATLGEIRERLIFRSLQPTRASISFVQLPHTAQSALFHDDCAVASHIS
jgi:hypothetical protein